MKLTEKTAEVLEIVKNNEGRVNMATVSEVTGRGVRSISATVNDLAKKGLATREKETVEGQDKPVTYIVLTDEGRDFVPAVEDAE